MVMLVEFGWTTGGLRNKLSSLISSGSSSSTTTMVCHLSLLVRGRRRSLSESELIHMMGEGIVVDINFHTCAVLSRGWDGGVVVLSLTDVADMGEGSLRSMTM